MFDIGCVMRCSGRPGAWRGRNRDQLALPADRGAEPPRRAYRSSRCTPPGRHPDPRHQQGRARHGRLAGLRRARWWRLPPMPSAERAHTVLFASNSAWREHSRAAGPASSISRVRQRRVAGRERAAGHAGPTIWVGGQLSTADLSFATFRMAGLTVTIRADGDEEEQATTPIPICSRAIRGRAASVNLGALTQGRQCATFEFWRVRRRRAAARRAGGGSARTRGRSRRRWPRASRSVDLVARSSRVADVLGDLLVLGGHRVDGLEPVVGLLGAAHRGGPVVRGPPRRRCSSATVACGFGGCDT